jgi:hypothetical protein
MSIEEQLERLDRLLPLIEKRARMAIYPIPRKAIPQGVSFCLANSRRLFEDAKALFNQQRYASSAHLGSLAYEELGKGVLIAASSSFSLDGLQASLSEDNWIRLVTGSLLNRIVSVRCLSF